MDIDNRPTKRRRFFTDDAEDEEQTLTRLTNGSSPSLSGNSSRNERASSQTGGVDLQPVNDTISTENFDIDTFCAFIGEQLDKEVVQKIQDASNGNMERAVNMYFDGSWKTSIPQRSHVQQNGIAAFMSKAAPKTIAQPDTSAEEHPEQIVLKQMPHERYVGSFGVEGWSTKSGTGLIRPGERVKIERTKLAPRTKLGRGGKPVAVIGRNQKADVITRFLNEKGQEVGRLPEETARWVSALLDQKICRLQGTCVFADDRLRVNDTVFLQIQVFMLKTAFDSSNFIKPADDNRETGFFAEKESTEEKDLRMRQVALVKLFDEINLHPTSSNSTVAKHKKEGLLRAAEMAEQHEKENKDKPKTNGETPGVSDVEEEGDELEDDQLDALYRKAQQFDFSMPEAQPANTFVLNLRKYQRQALHWMMGKERDEKQDRQDSMHPLWEEYRWPTKDANDDAIPTIENQDQFYVNLYSGEISLEFPVQEQNCLGGILADEMGLGKTIEMFSLIHTNRSPEALAAASVKPVTSVNNLPRLAQTSTDVCPAPYTTLVVAPMSLLAQWESEAVKSSRPGTIRTLVYYGSDKSINLQTLCGSASSAPNVIITSYGVVLSEFNQIAASGIDRGSHGGLFSVDFFRIILDEAHTIKNRQAKTSKACYELKGKHRWTLTGTPIVNRLEDLFSLVRFLKVEPWSNFSFWKTFITVPFEAKDFVRALNVVSTVLEPLVIRRTKDMKTPDGEALVPLPVKEISIEEIELSKTERDVYDLIFHRAKRAFNESIAAGTLMKSYTTIFAQILRLRQSCCHPVLTRNKDIVADEEEAAAARAAAEDDGLEDDMDLQDLIDKFTADTKQAATDASKDPINTFSQNALRQIQTDSSGECPICSEEPMIKPVVTTCWHSACKNCLEGYISHQTDKGEQPRCPVCRGDVNPRDIFEVVRFGVSTEVVDTTETSTHSNEDQDMYGYGARLPKISLRRLHPYSPTNSTSAKVAALLNHLTALPRGTKSVVFSQFTSFLDLIGPQLTRHGILHLRFDGTMSQKVRANVLREFTAENSSPSAPRVLLLSLRAGGVGLNLTAASRCYMMDPWWAYAVEAQAIDRVHRMGQTSKVEVVRFIVKDSIEGRMLKVQERKMAVAGTLGVGHGGGGGGGSIEDLKELLG